MSETSSEVPAWVDAWIAAWDGHDGGALAELYTADGTYRDVPTGLVAKGPFIAGFAHEYAEVLTQDLRWRLRSVAQAGERAHIEWTLSATNVTLVPGDGAAGRPFTVEGVTTFELDVADGRIRASADYYDQATVLRALGVLPG